MTQSSLINSKPVTYLKNAFAADALYFYDPVLGFQAVPTPAQGLKTSRIKAAVQAAINNNPVELAPLGPAPTWAINTIYGAAAIVRGTGADAVNLYFMAGNLTGTGKYGTSSMLAGGPSGVGNAQIIDNTCSWFYLGKVNATGTYPLYSAVTPAASTDIMNGYVAFLANAAITGLGLTRVYTNDRTTPWTRIGGALKLDLGQAYINPLGANINTLAAPAYGASRAFMEFVTSAQQWIALQCIPNINGNYISGFIDYYDVEVNGRKLSESGVNFYTGGSGAFSILLNLVPFGNVNKTIRLTPKASNGWGFLAPYKAYVKDDEAVWASTPPNKLKVSIEGDSTAQGGFFGQISGRDFIEHLLMNQLGFTDCYNNAIGGTSATGISNGGANTTYGQRLSDIASLNPDLHFIAGFHNELGNYQGAGLIARRAAILQYFKDCRTAMPNALIVILPFLPLAGDSLVTGGANSLYDLEIDVQAQFITWGDTNSLFIPFQLQAVPFFKGNNFVNTSWYHSAAGAAPYNDSHPVNRGYRVWSQYVVNAIRNYFTTY